MELLNFRSQKLKLDFLTLSQPGFDNPQKIRNLANYFYCIHGFNSFLSEGNLRKIHETLFFNPQTKDTLIIRINYWSQLVLEFPGTSADKLYHLVQSNAIDWNSLELNYLSLSRIDIYYEQKKSDSFSSDQFDNFLIDSRKHILLKTRTKTIKLINNTKGRILAINKRSTPHYYRVYETSTAIRFELELKKSALHNLQRSFFDFQFPLFESNLIHFYFKYSITSKTEANALDLRDSLLEMPNREKIIWYTDGQYQGGTDRGCDSVNLFDPETGVIAVYPKQPNGSNLFLTTCRLTDKEIEHLKSTNGNFVTQEILEQQNWVNKDINSVNPMYENNFMDKNNPMDANSSPGFTSINNFQSDVMGITPIDNSEFNKFF